MSQPKTHAFQAEVSQVLRLVISSLYSHREVFLRELVSNASDALDRLRFRAIREPELMGEGETLGIRIEPNAAERTLTIADNGVGMSEEQLTRELGTIAWSGSKQFLEKLAEAREKGDPELQLIGQFGVGFYSAFLVADRVEVISRAAGASDAYRWTSDGKDEFQLEPAERDERGTSVILHLGPDHHEFLEEPTLRQLVTRYSDYVEHPIELRTAEGELEKVNRASALWQRSPKDIEKEQYEELYKHLSHDWEAPLAWKHFHIEGTQMFKGLIFLPRRRPFDLFDPDPRHGVRLHVRRVFVMDDCEELVPRWLRFIRGVVDSEDLPLNVSRETLQDLRAVDIIRRQVVSQSFEMLNELARERPDDYRVFWDAFGAVLKEGLHFDPQKKQQITELLRYPSTHGEGLVSLGEYVGRMPEDQTDIYYATGASREMLEAGPHLEAFRSRGWEVLLMTDPVDPFVVDTLGDFEGKALVSATKADLDVRGPDADEDEELRESSAPLLEKIREILGDDVDDVRPSRRLTESPACLVVPEGGMEPHVARMLRARQVDVPKAKRSFELNLTHPLVRSLKELHARDADAEELGEWVRVLYDQALLAEGSPIDDAPRFARRVAELLTRAASRASEQGGEG